MEEMIDLTNYKEIQEPTITKTIVTCTVRMDKNTILRALQSDCIYIRGEYFKVPEQTLLERLINKHYGSVKMDLELISN